jgi:hypothetical protein
MQTEKRLSPAQWNAIWLILAVAVGSTLYRLIVWRKLEQTSLLFIGIPTVLAILVTLTSKAKTVKGSIAKGITLALLMSGPLLGEGFICILMAAPLFYLVGLAAGAAVDAKNKKRNTTLTCVALFLLPMSFEGTSPQLSWNREETVSVSEIVSANVDAVEQAVSQSPRTDLPLPYYLRLGFPRPTQAQGSGLEAGSTRTIHFAGGEGHPGDLVMRVEESRPGYVRFVAVADHSKIAHWLDWEASEVQWQALDARHTRVTWTLNFKRRLDPAWYFGPWERYAGRLAAEYLIHANATPLQAERGK